MSDEPPLIQLENVEVHYENQPSFLDFGGEAETVRAVDGVSLDIEEHDVISLVGESGCGKTTLGKTSIGLQRPTGGSVKYRGYDIWDVRDGKVDAPFTWDDIRTSLQIIHQDPGSSLNPNQRIISILSEPLRQVNPELSRSEKRERIYALLERVGMNPAADFAERYPHQLSGGEKQRVALSRALLMNPDVILADEAISALDVSLRVEMVDLILFGRGKQAVTFHNDEGTLSRTDVGLGNFTYPLGATAADFDGDGDSDLFVYQSGSWKNGKPDGYFELTGRIEDDNGNPNYLYENTGGEFRRVEDSGLEGSHWSLAASAVDLNDDGATDIHVANDFYYDEVYINRGDGTFEHRYMANVTARNGMSSQVGDVNRDGSPDVFVTNIYLPLKEELSPARYERYKQFLQFVIKSGRTKGNTLMVNDGSGNLTDAADVYGVRKGGWGWAASFADYDNDGERDLMHTTQNVLRLDRSDPHYTYPMLWERTGDEFTSLDASDHGLQERDGRGMVTLDYDNDGEQEVITNNYAQNVTVYDNVGTTGNSLEFRAVNDDGTAFGAVVTVTAADETTVVHQTDRTDFLSQEGLRRHVGLGDAESADIHVTWPDGTERTFEDVSANKRVRITRDGIETVDTFETE